MTTALPWTMNERHFCFATQTRRDGIDCPDCRDAVVVSYVLVILGKGIAFGPFSHRDDAEYAALDYYGTAVTGASIKNEFVIAELHSGAGMAERQHDAHVRALMASDV